MTRITAIIGIFVLLSVGVAWAEHGKASGFMVACQVAEEKFCEHFSDGAFHAYEDTHVVCPGRDLRSDEIWEMMKEYFLSHPDLRLPNFAAYIRVAASEKYPCTNDKPSRP